MRFRNSILSSSNTVEAVRPKPPTSQKSQELNRSPPHPALPSAGWRVQGIRAAWGLDQ